MAMPRPPKAFSKALLSAAAAARTAVAAAAAIAAVIVGLAVGLSASLAAGPAGAGPAEAANGPIEAVIADQLAAFQRNDLTAAFAHAAPGIRAKFGTPQRFGHMVARGYPMIWRPSRVEWLGLADLGDGTFVKTVLFVDAAGRPFEVDYLMGETDGVWRIRGVHLRKLPGLAS